MDHRRIAAPHDAESPVLPVSALLLAAGFAIAVMGNAYSTIVLGTDTQPFSRSPGLTLFAIAHLVVGFGLLAAGLVSAGRALVRQPDRRLLVGGSLAGAMSAAVAVLQTLSFWAPHALG